MLVSFQEAIRLSLKYQNEKKLLSLFTSVLLGRKETPRILLLLTLLTTRQINVTGCFQSYLMGASSSEALVFRSFGSGRCCHSFLAQIPIFFSSMETGEQRVMCTTHHTFIQNQDMAEAVTWTQKVVSGLAAHCCPPCRFFSGTQGESQPPHTNHRTHFCWKKRGEEKKRSY